MMEFFLSKFWAFMVAMVVMGVLVQGMQLEANSDRNEALNDLAEELERLFNDVVGAGAGLETTIDLGRLLPPSAALTVFTGHAVLIDGSQEVRFPVPPFSLSILDDEGGSVQVDRLVLDGNDSLLIKNLLAGPTMMALNR
jgi:hypothetical protein